MHEHVTVLRPAAGSEESRASSFSLPVDLLERAQGRLGILALLVMFGFALDPLMFFGSMAIATLRGIAVPPEVSRNAAFYWGDLVVVAVSASLWWITRTRQLSATALQVLSSCYEVAICFVIAFRTFWEYYVVVGILPHLTWAPAVIILFPLIMPTPPRLMLAAGVVAGAMPVVALFVLDFWGKVPVDISYFLNTGINSGIAVGFAYMGSKVVYGLGRELAVARELGSYRLEEKLGQGGMGEVWRARHRMLARPAAIKLMRTSLAAGGRSGASVEATRRFEREAQVIARLRSPHTVDLFDFGVASDGAFYYVMELLDGLDADKLVRRGGPIPAERAIHLLRQVCHSLSEAESHGLVHRDIKPANIFLCRYGEELDFVKVLDFGIVKATHETAETEEVLTRELTVHGTPAFIAPEQALGVSVIDGRADIYAVGCVAYWLLTGQLVFTADTPMALLLHHAHTTPVALSTRTELAIPEALDRLVLSCLSKDPADRPQSAKELSRRLGEVPCAGAWTDDRARDWWALHQPAAVDAYNGS